MDHRTGRDRVIRGIVTVAAAAWLVWFIVVHPDQATLIAQTVLGWLETIAEVVSSFFDQF